MNEKIKTFLEKETGRMIDDANQNLIEVGILDSFSMFKLISFLEIEYDVRIPMEELSPDNFNSVSAIRHFLQQQKQS